MPGLHRGLRLLEILAATRGACSFTRLRAAMDDLPAPTLSRLLKALVASDWVTRQATGLYGPGPAMLRTMRLYLDTLPRATLLAPVVEELALRTHQSSAYYELDGEDALLLAKCEQVDSFHYMPVRGRNRRFCHNCFCQALIAWLPREEQYRYHALAGGRQVMARTRFRKRLREIREQGLAVHDGRSEPFHLRLAAPITDPAGAVVGALGITMLPRPLAPAVWQRLEHTVREAAARATALLARPQPGDDHA